MSTYLLFCTLSCLLLSCWAITYMTEYDKHFRFDCPNGQVLISLESKHDNKHEDRVWNFGCGPLPKGAPLGSCAYSELANDYDKLLAYQCPGEGVVAGLEGYHDNRHEDRRFKIRCCQIGGGYVSHGCSYTGYANTYDNLLSYRVPANLVMRGITSVHDNGHEDRLFKFEICQIDRAGSVVG